MNVLSLFDGISCGRIALERAGITVDTYIASEIDTGAIRISERNYPDITRLGDVCNIKAADLPKIDLLIGGSPCQGFSRSGKMLNFDDPRSKLFFAYYRLLRELKPTWFLLENVKMKAESTQIITNHMGVTPVFINSNKLSAQNRPRMYWSNIPVNPVPDIGITINSILDAEPIISIPANAPEPVGRITAYTETRTEEAKAIRRESMKNGKDFCPRRGKVLVPRSDGKCNCLTASADSREHIICDDQNRVRYLTVSEWERLQTLPLGYTSGESDRKRKHAIGNGWSVDVIAHIFSGLSRDVV